MTSGEVLVPLGERATLAPLVSAYVIEMSEIIGVPPGDGRYPFFDLYWTEPETRYPFWLKVAGKNAGFAPICRNREAERTDMAEFYVTPEFRRKGIGLAAARRLIVRFPGPWQITQREANLRAIGFWHRVLDQFVAYRETTTVTDAIRRQQRFVIS